MIKRSTYCPGVCSMLILLFWAAHLPVGAIEPIQPIPLSVDYDRTKALLGKQLFFDKGLSSDKRVSCASCHQLTEGGDDGSPVSYGVDMKLGTVNAPTVLNAYFNFRQFWDGRARDLKEQASGPLHNPVEMNLGKERILNYINSQQHYVEAFSKAFGDDPIKYGNVLDAIVEFEKALITPNAKFDRYLRGETELSKNELEGYHLFKRLGCASCHNGINIGGNSFQYMGAVIPYDQKKITGDMYHRTRDPFDRSRYKVPTLRNITLTAPYMHTGGIQTLRDMVATMAKHNIGLELTGHETDRIVDFLKTLTGDRPEILDAQ